MQKIKVGDEVVVTTGRSKGQRGRVTKLVDGGKRVLVEGANLVKKHQKPNPQAGEQGGIIEMEAPLAISNVMLWNESEQRGCRVGIETETDSDGKTRKVRVFKLPGGKTQVVES